jgi:hypothetical protein
MKEGGGVKEVLDRGSGEPLPVGMVVLVGLIMPYVSGGK